MSSHWSEARRAARERHDYQALIELIPYARFLGIRAEGGNGRLCLRLPFRDSLIGNPRRRAWHGGVTAAFMENAALLQLLLQLDEDRVPKSIDFAIDYLLPGRAEDLHADCTVSRLGSRVAHTVIRCWQREADQPIAVARAHFLLSAS
ncbi:PaaI family thioesterase [Solimonas terrae]|uniref:PaaI family thioesterase n=1 Tax=Solimonas terrae TaxID=1396819 RepID=A0A6M2BUR5_9GAMM|nr:PaaI family thioesterase [Solimonas terrae]NGY06124.1 PaaI family thioesterase [Solimonas terrae]